MTTEIKKISSEFFNIDRILMIILVVFTILYLPPIFKGAQNARILEVVANDEPLITMQLEGMTVPPYGNPANFLKVENESKIPGHWYNMRYFDIIYYGGLYLDIALAIFAPLKFLGVKIFPAGPLILRFLSFFFAFLSLIVLYNFAKRYFGIFVAIFTTIFILLYSSFVIFAILIHPDSLLFLLALLCLWTATLHSQKRRRSTLLLLALIVGFAHGTKAAAPWFLPMAGLAILIANQKELQKSHTVFFNKKYLISVIKDGFILGILSILFFIVTTPYVILDSYYFKTFSWYFKYFTSKSTLYENINLWNWLTDIHQDFGTVTTMVVIGSLGFVFYRLYRTRPWRIQEYALFFAIVLMFSNILWYGNFGSSWVQLFYLMPAFSIMGLLIGILCQNFLDFANKQNHKKFLMLPMKETLKGIVIIAGFSLIIFFPTDWPRPNSLLYLFERWNLYNSSAGDVNNWAATHMPSNSKILHDGKAYLDPNKFPEQLMGSNLLQYDRIYRNRPNYVILTYWGERCWIRDKMKTQNADPCDPDPVSVRLYQDLIPSDPQELQPGPTKVPHIELMHIVREFPKKKLSPFRRAYCSLRPDLCGYREMWHNLDELIFKIDPQFYQDWEKQCHVKK